MAAAPDEHQRGRTAGSAPGFREWLAWVLPLVPATALAAGAALWALGRADLAPLVWIAGVVPVLALLLVDIAANLLKREVGLDIVAALAMGGAIIGGEELAAVVVALMFAGGEALEAYAQGSAQREMTALLGRVARTAQRRRSDGLETVEIERIAPGDVLLIRAGEGVPVDGFVQGDAPAVLDESALTGESRAVRRERGDAVASGVTNAGAAFELKAARRAADSTYAGVVRLVESARASKAPMARLADLYSLAFLAATLAVAGAAWLISGTWERALAVLVVATPCPLILAVPVAVVSGMSASARVGVLAKSAKTLESLARVKTLLIDKTGTLTVGRASLSAIRPVSGVAPERLLAVAAALAQASQHAASETLVAAARAQGLTLALPDQTEEHPGRGLKGRVEGRTVAIGSPGFVAAYVEGPEAPQAGHDGASVAVAIDGRYAGALDLADALRPDADETLRAFRTLGVDRIVLVTGDRGEVAGAVAHGLPIDAVISDASPRDKLEAVRAEAARGHTLMVGDGVNDAPALALADVGVALGARGAAAAAEAADAVVLVDRLDRIADAIHIAQSTRAIATQSVIAGLGLSGIGMIAAAFGYLPPIAGALAQEVIDVAVVLNALRCLRLGAPARA